MTSPFPASALSSWPTVDEASMREVDRVMMEDLHVGLLQMMENAGRGLATVALRCFGPTTVTVLAGPGGNGGGGMAAARHLANHGVKVTVTLTHPLDELTAAPREQYEILRASGVRFTDEPQHSDLTIDAMVSYSLRGAPRGRTTDLVRWANASEAPTLALDVPTGFSSATGQLTHPHIKAAATLTLAAPKTGLAECAAAGDLYVADIAVPPQVYRPLGFEPGPLFGDSWIVRLLT